MKQEEWELRLRSLRGTLAYQNNMVSKSVVKLIDVMKEKIIEQENRLTDLEQMFLERTQNINYWRKL